jgi:2-keto-4-pentenoate hydratase/2-oxohepta-3-ene-1,7-dioic acid hydratase in catechol pathway
MNKEHSVLTKRPRFAAFTHQGTQQYGAITEAGVVVLSPHFPQWPTLQAVVAAGALGELRAAASRHPATIAEGEVSYTIPIAAPEKIICVGVNFPDRNEEYKDGQAAPTKPSLFIRFPRSFVGHEASLIRPPESEQIDYEGEIAIIIGKCGRRIAEADALNHIAALSLCNEGTLRDWVRHAKFNVTQGKNFDNSGAIGPWLVPFEDKSQLADIKLTTRVNGELRQEDRTSRMIFPISQQIAYISTFTTLVPGDIIVTGTPTGAGARFDPPIWLKPGDVIEVEAEGVGILRNFVEDERP